jgi:hypothetical protein
MAEYVNEDKPMVIVNETDSDFNVGVGVVFRKSGIYEISVNDRTTTVTRVSKRKTGQWIKIEEGIKIALYGCSECGRRIYDDRGYDPYVDYPYCHCGARMEGENVI